LAVATVVGLAQGMCGRIVASQLVDFLSLCRPIKTPGHAEPVTVVTSAGTMQFGALVPAAERFRVDPSVV
jgi:hypothetical protein